MRVSHLFMEEYLHDGERIIGSIVGMAENGIISEYLIRNFNESIKGMFVSNPECRLTADHNKSDRKPPGRLPNILTLHTENLEGEGS